ncbi:hypothetical protein LUZ60_017530 [Juncus effusus]|nr:hypothetical protein LUZ60_017530 [Juncus effusus]
MATKRSVGTLTEGDLKGKRVFVRADLNVPLDDKKKITDDTRIRASVPTLKYLMERGSKIVLASHLGRPKGVVSPKYSLKPLVPRLSELLGIQVVMANDCVGEEVESQVAALPEGGVLLLENVRFHKEEEKNEPEFAKKLAALADLYVNDVFGTAHRAHASTEGVTKFLKQAVDGLLMQKDLDCLIGTISKVKKPFAAILGASLFSRKFSLFDILLERVDILIIGGSLTYTFYKALGFNVGSSVVEENKVELARSVLEKAKAKNIVVHLPLDIVISNKYASNAENKVVGAGEIPEGWMGMDIGPDSIILFGEVLATSQTIIWDGPMGAFHFVKFAVGTNAIAKKLAELTTEKGVTTIIGGRDSVAAVEKAGLAHKISHILPDDEDDGEMFKAVFNKVRNNEEAEKIIPPNFLSRSARSTAEMIISITLGGLAGLVYFGQRVRQSDEVDTKFLVFAFRCMVIATLLAGISRQICGRPWKGRWARLLHIGVFCLLLISCSMVIVAVCTVLISSVDLHRAVSVSLLFYLVLAIAPLCGSSVAYFLLCPHELVEKIDKKHQKLVEWNTELANALTSYMFSSICSEVYRRLENSDQAEKKIIFTVVFISLAGGVIYGLLCALAYYLHLNEGRNLFADICGIFTMIFFILSTVSILYTVVGLNFLWVFTPFISLLVLPSLCGFKAKERASLEEYDHKPVGLALMNASYLLFWCAKAYNGKEINKVSHVVFAVCTCASVLSATFWRVSSSEFVYLPSLINLEYRLSVLTMVLLSMSMIAVFLLF